MRNKYQEYFSSLSTPDLLRVTLGCQKRYEEGKSCTECYLFKQDKCDGKRTTAEQDRKLLHVGD